MDDKILTLGDPCRMTQADWLLPSAKDTKVINQFGGGAVQAFGADGAVGADALVQYLQALTVTQGRHAGSRLKLLHWQRKFLSKTFREDVQTAALSVGRGNGKSTLVAGIACSALDGALAIPRGETIVVAASFAQGRIVFEHVLHFLADKLHYNKAAWRVLDNSQHASIEYLPLNARLRCIGSDPGKAHGLAPRLVLCDEPAQWDNSTADRMLASLKTALGKIPDSRLIALGTRPAARAHWFERMLNGGADYALNYAAPAGADPFSKVTWRKANPSLDHMPDLLKTLKSEARDAKLDPSTLASFKALRLNQGVSDTVESVLLDAGVWESLEGQADRVGRPLFGIDLGSSAAMSAIAAYWPESGRLEVLAGFPANPNLLERGRLDGVADLYQLGHERGELIICGTHTVKVVQLLTAAVQAFGAPRAIAADRWREGELRESLKDAGIPVCPIHTRGQGFKDGAEDVRGFKRACLEGAVVALPNLTLTSAMAEARVQTDPAGNQKLAKQTQGGRRLRARDDAAAASILAVALGYRLRKMKNQGKPKILVAG